MILLATIFSREIFKLFFLFQIKQYSGNQLEITTIWIALQIVFSSFFGYISDRNYRKAILVLSLVTSLFSIIFLQYHLFWITVIINGVFCNVTPIARAAYCNCHPLTNRTKLMTNTFLAQSLPWIVVLCWDYVIIDKYLFDISIAVSLSAFAGVLFLFNEPSNKILQSSSKELKNLKTKYATSTFIKLSIAFVLLEISYQIMPYFNEAHFNIDNLQKSYLFLGIGVTIGCLFHKFIKVSNHQKIMNYIILGGCTLFFLEFLATYFTDKQYFIPLNIYLLFAFLGGLYWPLIYAIFAEKAKMHEEGLIFGSLESLQSIAEIFPPFIFIWYQQEKLGYFPFFILLGTAFFLTFKRKFFLNNITNNCNKWSKNV